jgi:AcrR family transcriptional regulator
MTTAETLARVEHACAQLISEHQSVTFAAVAAQAGLSRASIYRDQTLRAVVDEHRALGRDPRTLSSLSAEISHLRLAVEALAERVRQHEEILRKSRAPTRQQRKAN